MAKRTNGKRFSPPEASALTFMLSVLGFKDVCLRLADFHQTTQAFGVYETFRHQGLSQGLSVYRLLYG